MSEMSESTIWWVLAGSFVAVELMTGTFYLLMLSLGLVAAAIAAHLGATTTVQLVVAASVSGSFVVAWRSYKLKTSSTAIDSASVNHDVNLDVGETVYVEAWNPDGSSSVKYRGANWGVLLTPGAQPDPGNYKIMEVVGSRLVVKKL